MPMVASASVRAGTADHALVQPAVSNVGIGAYRLSCRRSNAGLLQMYDHTSLVILSQAVTQLSLARNGLASKPQFHCFRLQSDRKFLQGTRLWPGCSVDKLLGKGLQGCSLPQTSVCLKLSLAFINVFGKLTPQCQASIIQASLKQTSKPSFISVARTACSFEVTFWYWANEALTPLLGGP